MNFKSTFFVAIISLAIITLPGCSGKKPYEVKMAGKAKNVMQGTDLSNHISLDTVLVPGLYGLGPYDNLQGEITVYNGVPFVSSIENGKVKMRVDSNAKAPFFVYSHLKSRKVKETVRWKNVDDIDHSMQRLKKYFDIPEDDAFPFIVEAEFSKIKLHIIMRDTNEIKHSHEAHSKAKVHLEYKNIQGKLIGFYSKHHEGVFTPKDSRIHVHFLAADGSVTGHLDGIRHLSGVKVSIPDM